MQTSFASMVSHWKLNGTGQRYTHFSQELFITEKLCLSLIFISQAQIQIGRLHCLYPWWEDAAVSFMTSGGYNVTSLIKKVTSFIIEKNKCILVLLQATQKIVSAGFTEDTDSMGRG